MNATVKRWACKALTLAAVAAVAGTAQAATLRLQAFGDPSEQAALREVIKAFAAVAPDVQVELIGVAKQGDHMAKLSTSFAAGDPPDLFLLNFRRFGQLASRGVLEPLGQRLSERGKFKESDYYEPPMEAFRQDGTLMCVPLNVSTQVVFYNVKLFKQAGLAPPSPDWTWADFTRTAKALTREADADGKNAIYGVAFENVLIRLLPFVWMAGGEVVDNLNKPTRFTLDTPAANEGLDYVRSWATQKLMPPLSESRGQEYEARFARGGIGMVLNSRRYTTVLRAVPDLDWDVAPLPRGKQTATVLHSDGYCMAKASTNKDAAYRFVEFAVGPAGASVLARTGRTVPSLKSVALGPDFLDPTAKPKSAKVFLDSIAQIRRPPNIGSWSEIENRSDALIEAWLFGPPTKPLGQQLDEATQGLFNKP